jgi:hypothetical protein
MFTLYAHQWLAILGDRSGATLEGRDKRLGMFDTGCAGHSPKPGRGVWESRIHSSSMN